jgi:hypothetical protein
MAATVQTTATTSIRNMMHEQLEDKVFLAMQLESPELQIFKLKTKQLNGKYLRLNFQDAGNSRFEPRAENAFLPGDDPATDVQDQRAGLSVKEMKFGRRQMYASVDFTGPMAAAVKSKEGGYENLMEARFKDTERNLVERVGIALATGEQSIMGIIKSVNKTTGVATLYGQNEAGGASVSVALPEVGNRYIRPGMVLDCVAGSSAGAGRNGDLRVTTNDKGRRVTARSRDIAAPTVTFAAAGSDLLGNAWDADDFLTLRGARRATGPASATDSEDAFYGPRGLLDVVDDGTLQPYYGQLDRTAAGNEFLQCQRLGNAGTLRSISLDLINQACETGEVVAGSRPDVIYTTPSIRRQLVKFLTATIKSGSDVVASSNPTRYNQPGAEKITIGVNQFDVLTLGPSGRMTIMSSRLAPHHMVFLLQRDTTMLFQDSAPGFMDNDGLKVRNIDGTDSFKSVWKWYAPGMICQQPWKNIRIDDVTGSLLD